MNKIVTSENIQAILASGESDTVEFKTKVRSSIHVLPKIISAFANTNGGILILGYDEMARKITGTSNAEIEIIQSAISNNNLDDICSVYSLVYNEKTLIIVQVKKSTSLVIAGGGAYVRKGDNNIITLSSKEVVNKIASTTSNYNSVTSQELLERLEKKTEQIYEELIRSQKEHEEELKAQKLEHDKELKSAKRSNWFFCILSAVIGYGLGKFF